MCCSERSPIRPVGPSSSGCAATDEQTVGALTARAKVSQPAVSKHLGVLKQAGLVRDRHEGRQTHYSAQLGALGPADRLDQPDGRLLAKPVRPARRSAQKDGPMTNTATETRSVVVEREMPYPPEKIWRALTQPHLIAEWLMKNDFKPVVGHQFQSSRRPSAWLERRRRLRGPCGRAEQDAVLHVESPAKRTLPSRVSSHCLSRPRAPARFCAWSRPASGRIRSKIIKARNMDGSISSAGWSRSWRGRTEISPHNPGQSQWRGSADQWSTNSS